MELALRLSIMWSPPILLPKSRSEVQRGRGDNHGTQLWRPDGALFCGWVMVMAVSVLPLLRLRAAGRGGRGLVKVPPVGAQLIHETIRSLSPPKAPFLGVASIAYSLVRRAL